MMDLKQEVTVGIAGAAGDGLDKTGDTLARTALRLGLYVYAYNSYQSLVRGGHTWLRIRLSEEKVRTHGDHINALIALNQDSIERHAHEIEPGGVIIFNSEKIDCPPSLLRDGVTSLGVPIGKLTKPFGRIPAVMQNSVLLGALLFWLNLDFSMTEEVYADTFAHKGQKIIDSNVDVARAGFEYAANSLAKSPNQWTYTHIRRPFMTGNEATALGAVAGGLKFYAAYPMTPASTILHWLIANGEKAGVMVKQAEDELAVINMAIGAGIAGTRSMCGTSGGGFALMTEAIGMASIMEVPVVIVTVQRGGPSTGLPTKTEQADLNQVYGASQGDYPRVIIAPTTVTDAFYTAAEAHNLAEQFQLPVIILSDLLLGEHPETIEPDALTADMPIERGKLLTEVPDGYNRFSLTADHVSARVLPGTPGTAFVLPSDDHDEEGIVISDVFTNPPLRRKMQEKRLGKMEKVLSKLTPPKLEGPTQADITLVGWGSTWGVIHETLEQLASAGITANHLHIKYLVPFHVDDVSGILSASKRVIVVENNGTGQFARHLRAETGIKADEIILKYDGEPFSPRYIVEAVQNILKGQWPLLDVSQEDAREIAYHYIRIKLGDSARPDRIEQITLPEYDEPLWNITLVGRKDGELQGTLRIGVQTGSTYGLLAPANG
jgi:2-oxoglutarate/2-oxoacid ferredoxin oxidoreductase subunit alpha